MGAGIRASGRCCPGEGGFGGPEYTAEMATLETGERHHGLLVALLAEVESYTAPSTATWSRALSFAAAAHEGQQRRSGSTFIEHPVGVARICAELRLDEQTIAAALLHDVVEDTDDRHRGGPRRVRRRDRAARRGRHQADADQLPEPRASRGGELPQDDRRDVRGRPRDPHQARGPAAQHAHDRVPRQAEADPEGEGDARGLRAARAPARHPGDQVGARGPRVPDAAPAQVRGDQDDGRRAARRPRRDVAEAADVLTASSTRSTSRPRSRAARSTSTRSTTRWRRRAASSTRSSTSPRCA